MTVYWDAIRIQTVFIIKGTTPVALILRFGLFFRPNIAADSSGLC